jgi:hypothetical protein
MGRTEFIDMVSANNIGAQLSLIVLFGRYSLFALV